MSGQRNQLAIAAAGLAATADRVRAEVQLIGRLGRSGREAAQYPCPICNGTVSLGVVRRDHRGVITQSAGRCSTAHCLEWNR